MNDKISTNDMRLVISGAACVIEKYAFSTKFDWERDLEILRPIAQAAEKLIDILDKEGGD